MHMYLEAIWNERQGQLQHSPVWQWEGTCGWKSVVPSRGWLRQNGFVFMLTSVSLNCHFSTLSMKNYSHVGTCPFRNAIHSSLFILQSQFGFPPRYIWTHSHLASYICLILAYLRKPASGWPLKPPNLLSLPNPAYPTNNCVTCSRCSVLCLQMATIEIRHESVSHAVGKRAWNWKRLN